MVVHAASGPPHRSDYTSLPGFCELLCVYGCLLLDVWTEFWVFRSQVSDVDKIRRKRLLQYLFDFHVLALTIGLVTYIQVRNWCREFYNF